MTGLPESLRARIEGGTAVLWCAHYCWDEQRECTRVAARTAVGWREVRRMMLDLYSLIAQRRTPYQVSRGLPEVYVWPAGDVIAVDPGARSEIVAIGEPVGVHLLTGDAL